MFRRICITLEQNEREREREKRETQRVCKFREKNNRVRVNTKQVDSVRGVWLLLFYDYGCIGNIIIIR
jgi:hypothetical protein